MYGQHVDIKLFCLMEQQLTQACQANTYFSDQDGKPNGANNWFGLVT